MDNFEFQSKTFLVGANCYSHFPELCMLKQKRNKNVIAALKLIFAVHGPPASIMANSIP